MSKSASGRDRRVGAVATTSLTAIALVALAWMIVATPARAAIVQFTATLDGAQQVPPSGSAGTGSGTFVMDTVANTMSVSITYSGLGSAVILGHIHGAAPPGMNAGIIFPFANPNSPVNETWNNISNTDEASVIAGLTYANIHTTGFVGGEIRGQILRTPTCGDEILDGGEQCDDGNTVNGDCCGSTCQFEAASSDCGDGLCSNGTCDGAGNCGGGGTPRTNCLSAQKSLLLIKNDNDDDTKDKLIFKWIKGAATTVGDFGVPTGTTTYALCIYSGTAQATAVVPPSMSFWSTAGTTGFKYKDKGGKRRRHPEDHPQGRRSGEVQGAGQGQGRQPARAGSRTAHTAGHGATGE